MDWQNKRIKLYIEAGLALLLVLTLALAGASGILPASADDSGRVEGTDKSSLRSDRAGQQPGRAQE